MMDFNASEVSVYYADRVPNLKQVRGREWRGPCPVHGGKDDNFAVNAETGQAFCHSQCGRGWDMLDLEQELSHSDFPTAKKEVFQLIGRPEPSRFDLDIVAAYDYTDAQGDLLYQVVRRSPKRFGQRRPDGNGGWVWSLGNMERVPFQLHKIVESQSPIVIVEGEKDALNLTKRGLLATCNSEGAGKWRPELNQYFKDRQVWIIPDNDEPGRAHALKVAASLYGTARGIKMVELPGSPVKGDVSDFLASGKTIQDVKAALQAGQTYTPDFQFVSSAPVSEHGFSLDRLPNVWDIDAPIEWLVDGLFVHGAMTLVTGDSGVGKSTLSLALAGAVAQGKPFLNRVTGRKRVLYVDGENPVSAVRERLDRLHIPKLDNLDLWGGWVKECQPQGPECLPVLEWARKHKGVIIYDSLIQFHPGSEQDSSETRQYLKLYRDLVNEGCAVILLHHTGKGENSKQYRGSSDIKAAADQAFCLELIGQAEEGRSALRLLPFKSRMAHVKTLRLDMSSSGFHASEHGTPTNREIVEQLIEENPDMVGVDLVKLAVARGVAKNRAEAVLVEGARDGWLIVTLGSRNAKCYRLRGPDE